MKLPNCCWFHHDFDQPKYLAELEYGGYADNTK